MLRPPVRLQSIAYARDLPPGLPGTAQFWRVENSISPPAPPHATAAQGVPADMHAPVFYIHVPVSSQHALSDTAARDESTVRIPRLSADTSCRVDGIWHGRRTAALPEQAPRLMCAPLDAAPGSQLVEKTKPSRHRTDVTEINWSQVFTSLRPSLPGTAPHPNTECVKGQADAMPHAVPSWWAPGTPGYEYERTVVGRVSRWFSGVRCCN